MACSECVVLRKELEEGKAQVARYEVKIRDTVNAYKMLESQKQSLEVALSVLSIEEDSNEKIDEKAESAPSNLELKADNSESNSNEKQQEKPDQREALKQAISTLTLVNKRKELEFKRDRRALVEAKDELQQRCEQLEQQLKEQRQQSKSQNLRRLREQLAEMQSTQERAMTEHGMVLAEMQQQYGKEKRHSENLGKQMTEMSQRLAAKDELLKRMEIQLKSMSKMEKEMESLRRKAEMTPTARVIQDELANVKASSDQEVSTLRTRYALQSAQLRERDSRIEQLEQRVQEMSERCAQRIELEQELLRAKNEEMAKKAVAEEEKRAEKKKEEKTNFDAATANLDELETIEHFRALYQQLKTKPGFDINAILAFELPIQPLLQFPRPLSGCSDTPSSTPVPAGLAPPSRNASSVSLAGTADGEMEQQCDSCMEFRRELDYFKRKLAALEKNHERMKREHQQSSEMLRERIFELESSQNRQYTQLTVEAKQRVAELEEELQKQRNRMLEIVAEKNREIELTKNSLAQFYARNYSGAVFIEEEEEQDGNNSNQNLPMDPPQPTRPNSSPESPARIFQRQSTLKKAEEKHRSRTGTADTTNIRRKGSISSADRRSVDEADLIANGGPFGGSSFFAHQFGGDGTMLAGAAARNIFYEQELCKREKEISELRNVIRLLEMKVRDIEQAMLLKDVQYLQIIETLKEEIRVLEGRLTLASSQTNLAYLRNIFVQFLNQSSANGRKHILKAIGAVLQLTSVEMQRVDRWNH